MSVCLKGQKRAAQGRKNSELFMLKSGMGVPAISHFKNEFFISVIFHQEVQRNGLKNTIYHSVHIFFYKKGLFSLKNTMSGSEKAPVFQLSGDGALKASSCNFENSWPALAVFLENLQFLE